MLSLLDPTELFRIIEIAKDHNLCPNRIWLAGSPTGGWQSKQSVLRQALDPKYLGGALQHEDHSACNIDYCEFSSRNFTAVQQYHEPKASEKGDQAKIADNHKDKEVCFPLQGLFDAGKLAAAVKADKLTAWTLDGLAILEHPRPFMAVSHVWSDGTGTGTWPSTQVNECLYSYFQGLARRFRCEGIWWDTLCIPQDRRVRSMAINIMDRNFEYARVMLVHDRFLRNLSFENPDKACFAIVISSWFTRGWTALELVKSRKVKIIFKDSIQDLDGDILSKARISGNAAAETIRYLRQNRLSEIGDLLTILSPRYTSWLKDRATIAARLAGISIPDVSKDTFQRDIFQDILKKVGIVHHDQLFHNSITMSKGFGWCATNIFQLPLPTTRHRLRVSETGEVAGTWNVFSVDAIDPAKCVWGKSHELIEAKLRYALDAAKEKHLLLAIPNTEGNNTTGTQRGLLVRVLKNPSHDRPNYKCQYVGPLYFHPMLEANRCMKKEITIGDTDGWEDLTKGEDAWDIFKKENDQLPEELENKAEGVLNAQTIDSAAEPVWPEFHRIAWLDNTLTDEIITRWKSLKEDERRAKLQERDRLGQRALHLAAERGNEKMVKMLLSIGDDSRCIDSYKQTPLHRAAWGGNAETVKLLLDSELSLDAPDLARNTALHIAADMGFERVVEQLCERADINAKGRRGLTSLHYAALGGHYDVAKHLITRKAVVDIDIPESGWTALHCAAENGQLSVIKLLLNHGANIGKRDSVVGWTPLHIAAINGHIETVKILIDNKAKMNIADRIGWTPLSFAAINGHEAVVKELINRGANINESIFPWEKEEVETYKTVIEFLKSYKETFIEMLDREPRNGLYLAALDGRVGVITRLVTQNDVDNTHLLERIEYPALFRAARSGLVGAIRLLMRIGVNMQLRQGNTGFTPLHLAVGHQHEILIQVLLANGAATEIKDQLDRTPLFIACSYGYEVGVRILLTYGARTSDGSGKTPLYTAAWNGNEEIVRALLEFGANTEEANEVGDTPLLAAVTKGYETVVRVLLDYGARTKTKNNRKWTPLICARWGKHQGIIQALIDHGADAHDSDSESSSSETLDEEEDPVYDFLHGPQVQELARRTDQARILSNKNMVLLEARSGQVALPKKDSFSHLHPLRPDCT